MTDIIKDQIEQEKELKRLQTLPRFAFADRELARLFAKLIYQLATGKTEPEPKPQKPSKELVKWMREQNKVRRWNDSINSQAPSVLEQSYDQLDGKWLEWLEVARRFEHKVKAQDRLDLRHTIIVAFADQQARNERLGKPDLSLYGMLRIASHCVADYWREINKATIKVCVLNGLPTVPDHKCSFVGKPSKCSQCPFLAVRPIESLNTELADTEGNTVELIDTLADDKAIDLDQWLDDKTFRLGCPDRLIQLAVKRHKGIPLNQTDQRYFTRQRQRELKKYQKTLF